MFHRSCRIWLIRKLRLDINIINSIVSNPKTSVVVDDGKISIMALKSNLDFNDAAILFSAMLTNQPLATLDRELVKEAKRFDVSVITL